jgi:hypothetical protein
MVVTRSPSEKKEEEMFFWWSLGLQTKGQKNDLVATKSPRKEKK